MKFQYHTAIREITFDDAVQATELLNLDYPEPITVEQMRERLRISDAGPSVRRLVMEERTGDVAAASAADPRQGGRLIGYAHAVREEWQDPGVYWIHVVVARDARRQGHGQTLYAAIEEWAKAQGATAIKSAAYESVAAGLPFARRCGFAVDRRIFESTLDVTTFDEQPSLAALHAAQDAGLTFHSLADLGDTEEARHRLWQVECETARDIPGASEAANRPFDAFVQQVCGASGYLPDCQIVAVDPAHSDLFVGFAEIEATERPTEMYNSVTGVLPAYRSRGLARVIKLLAIRAARERGVTTLRTNNDSENAPMLAVNRALGYQPEPGYYRLLKLMDSTRSGTTNGHSSSLASDG